MPWASPAVNRTLGRNSVGACGQFRPEFQKAALFVAKIYGEKINGQAPAPHTSVCSLTGGPPSVLTTTLRIHRQTAPATPCLRLCLESLSVHTPRPPSLTGRRTRCHSELLTTTCHSGPGQGPRCPAHPHLPVPVARVAGNAVVEVPVGQRLLLIEDKLLQLHLHFCAGHRTWRRRKHRQVTDWRLWPGEQTEAAELGAEKREKAHRCARGSNSGCCRCHEGLSKRGGGREKFNKRPCSHEDFT